MIEGLEESQINNHNLTFKSQHHSNIIDHRIFIAMLYQHRTSRPDQPLSQHRFKTLNNRLTNHHDEKRLFQNPTYPGFDLQVLENESQEWVQANKIGGQELSEVQEKIKKDSNYEALYAVLRAWNKEQA